MPLALHVLCAGVQHSSTDNAGEIEETWKNIKVYRKNIISEGILAYERTSHSSRMKALQLYAVRVLLMLVHLTPESAIRTPN